MPAARAPSLAEYPLLTRLRFLWLFLFIVFIFGTLKFFVIRSLANLLFIANVCTSAHTYSVRVHA